MRNAEDLASNAQGRYYGFHEFKDYFTNRQLTALTTFSALVAEAQQKAETDAVDAGMADDHLPLRNGGQGARPTARPWGCIWRL